LQFLLQDKIIGKQNSIVHYFSHKNKIKMLGAGATFFYWSFKSPSDNSFQGHANGQLRK
jgi:hypothetical protein